MAVAAALNVTEPTSTGIGGDFFALYYDAKTRGLTALNGSGRAPAALTIDHVQTQNLASPEHQFSDPFHALNITVPGACAGWCDFIERHGTLAMSKILAPPSRLPKKDFRWRPRPHIIGVAQKTSCELHREDRHCLSAARRPAPARYFATRVWRAPCGRWPKGQGRVLQGEIAKSIAQAVQQSGGVMTPEDLAGHESTWDTPIHTTYRGLRVWSVRRTGKGSPCSSR